jgi:hypothetical protein
MLLSLTAVNEYMTATVYPDGSPRKTATFTVFVEESVVKVCFSDRDQEQTMWRSGASLEDALLAVETALCGDGADWRRSGPAKQSKGAKR